jgi:hypothetical protein
VQDPDPAKSGVVELPSGYFMPDATWDYVDAEVKRLQDAETGLTAANGMLKRQNEELGMALAHRPPSIGLKHLAIMLGIGLALGAGTTYLITR